MVNNIPKKFKVVDSVFFNGEIDYLLFRLTELNDSVDTFIILESLSDKGGEDIESEFEKNSHMFSKWEDKIIHIKSKNPTEEEFSQLLIVYESFNIPEVEKHRLEVKQIHDLRMCLVKLGLSFDDVIMVSKIDEIPVVPPMDILQSHLCFEPVILSQKDFIWSKNFIKPEYHFGTIFYLYSNFVLKSHLSYLIQSTDEYSVKLNLYPMKYGYRFSYFMGVEDSIKHISKNMDIDNLDNLRIILEESRNNLTYYDLKTLSEPKQLKKYSGELPKNIDMLSSQDIGRKIPKKHLIVFSSESLNDIEDQFDTISIVKKSYDLTDKPIKSEINTYPIFIPNEKYYDVLIDENSLENFQKMFFLNEIKKILYEKHPIDIDIFVFHYDDKKTSLTWSEIENEFLYDLLG